MVEDATFVGKEGLIESTIHTFPKHFKGNSKANKTNITLLVTLESNTWWLCTNWCATSFRRLSEDWWGEISYYGDESEDHSILMLYHNLEIVPLVLMYL
jgi:hypothetical protein